MICSLYKLFDWDYVQRCGDLPAPKARVPAGDGGKVISLSSVVCKLTLNCLQDWRPEVRKGQGGNGHAWRTHYTINLHGSKAQIRWTWTAILQPCVWSLTSGSLEQRMWTSWSIHFHPLCCFGTNRVNRVCLRHLTTVLQGNQSVRERGYLQLPQ